VFLSDRVVVMTPRPGRIHEILPIDLPRPRNLDVRDSPQFTGYAHHIGRLFRELGVIRDKQVA
jgi:NitT/TauT family transport system ATP-binding protein